MQKTPSYLKGLAETRARAAGEVERYSALMSELQVRLDKSKAELESCDRLIQRFDVRLDPTQIRPIHAWQGRYGKRGALKAAILNICKSAYPDAISSTEIFLQLELQLGLEFASWRERAHWRKHSVRNSLRRLDAQNLLQRVHERSQNNGTTGYWRWVAPVESLEGLAAMATAAGTAVSECEDYVPAEDETEDTLPA